MISKKAVFLLMAVILITSSISAEILLSQPLSLYSKGDYLNVEVELSSLQDSYLDVNLDCGNIINFYHNVPEAKKISIKRRMVSSIIGNSSGNCRIISSYGNESRSSQNFRISNLIELSFDKEKIIANAGEEVKITGLAIKDNNELLGLEDPAFIEFILEDNTSRMGSIKDGRFEINFLIPLEKKAGEYLISINAYDKDEKGNYMNEIQATLPISIMQKPSKIELALDKSILIPGDSLKVKPIIYDYAGDISTGQVSVKFTDSKDKIIFDGLINSNEEYSIPTEYSNTAGDARVIVKKDLLVLEKRITISDLKKAKAEMINSTLIIKNIGNVVYDKIIQIKIGNQTSTKEIKVLPGEEIKYELSAPEGSYNVEVMDEEVLLSEQGVSITGKVISINEIKMRATDVFSRYPMAWVFVIGILIFAGYVFYHKKIKKGDYSFFRKKENSADPIEKVRVVSLSELNIQKKDSQGKEIRRAEQVLALHGKKQECAVLALKIKNELTEDSKRNLIESLKPIYESKGVVYFSDDVVLGIFSPIITKTFKNRDLAILSAQNVSSRIEDINKKFKDVIKYGLAVHEGELIGTVEEDVFKFTSINKTLIIVKKLAEYSDSRIRISQPVHEKTISTVKVEKCEKNPLGIESFYITKVIDSEKTKKFIEEFLRRNS
jgi:hypothetical protein